MRHSLLPDIHELVVVGAGRGITWYGGPSRVRRRSPRRTWWAHGMRWDHRGARINRVWDRGRPFSWLVHKTYLRGHLGPYRPWEALLLLLGGDIELNPGPSSGQWAAAYTTLNKGVVKSATGCTKPSGDGLRWASFNIGGPTVDWDRWVTIVQLLSDMRLHIVGLQEVKPTFPNIEAATTLTFPEWQIYCHPHPSGTINGVAFLVRNTMDHFVLKDGNQRASLFADPDGTFLGLTLQLPNKPRLRVLIYYALQTAASKKRQDAFVETHQYDVLMGDFNHPIWSNTPSRFWPDDLLNRRLYDPLHELCPDGSVQAGHTRGCHRMDAILVSSRCWGNVSPMTYHTVAMPTSDHRLVLMTTGLTSTDCESFIKATHPAKKWNVRQERAAVQETQHILAGLDTPMDAISRADAVLKAVAQAVIRQGRRTKRTRLKTNTQQWHKHFQVAKKRIAQELREVANKRLYTMRHAALRKDGVFFRLTKNWTRGPLKPTQKQPSPDLARALLANFSGNPPYDMAAIEALIPQLIPQGHMTDDPPSFDEFKRACIGKRKKAVGPDGVPHRLLGMQPHDTLHTLYEGVPEVWRTGDIPQHWLRPEVVLMYKKGDPDRPENYRPIAVTNSIYRVIMKVYGPRLQRLVDRVASPGQYGSRPLHTATEQAANLVNSLHEHEMEGREPFAVLLDVAKALPSTIHEVIFSILNHAGFPPNYVSAFRTIYAHTDTYTDIQGERIYFKPTRGVKEGCPCSPLLFAIVYELLIKRLIAKYPDTFVYVDDIAIIVKDYSELERLLTDLSAWRSQIGIQFNPNKTEWYHFHRPPSSGATLGGAQQAKHIWWGQHRLDFKDPMFTYLGHTIAGVGYRGKARDALFAALQAQVAAYTILPLTSFERAQIVNSVLIPRWVYKILFTWDVCWGNRMETAFEEFVLQAPRVEKYLQYRLYTDVAEGGLGLHSASWAGLCALIQLVQRALRVPHRPMTRHTNSRHLAHVVEKYRTILLSFGMKIGRLPRAGQSTGRKAPKRAHDDLESLFDDEDSNDCRFESLVPHQYLQSLRPKSGTSPVQPNVEQARRAWHQHGQPMGSTWYSDGSLLEGRAGASRR